jgi:hypothetical protein
MKGATVTRTEKETSYVVISRPIEYQGKVYNPGAKIVLNAAAAKRFVGRGLIALPTEAAPPASEIGSGGSMVCTGHAGLTVEEQLAYFFGPPATKR